MPSIGPLQTSHTLSKGKQIIAPWLIGEMTQEAKEAYQSADIILSELYLNLLNNYS